MKKLLILTDYKGYFSSKFDGGAKLHTKVSINIDRIKRILEEDFDVMMCHYSELDLDRIYSDWYVIYASSEERGLFYKSYIEDILLKLMYDGAVLIPDFRYFRAHGNKSFMEILRRQFKDEELRAISSDIVGRMEELDTQKYTYPVVVKQSSGSGSIGVRLARSEDELRKIANEMSYVRYLDQFYKLYKDIAYTRLGWRVKTILYKLMKRSQRLANPNGFFHTNKFVIQNFVPNLDSDYKVLYYYGKYYVLHRKNRDNDFRASGSGKFSFPDSVANIGHILDFASNLKDEVRAPMISMDIASMQDGGVRQMYLIEFQCVGFGPYTIQYADWHFEKNGSGEWIRVDGRNNIEEETARSIKEFICDLGDG